MLACFFRGKTYSFNGLFAGVTGLFAEIGVCLFARICPGSHSIIDCAFVEAFRSPRLFSTFSECVRYADRLSQRKQRQPLSQEVIFYIAIEQDLRACGGWGISGDEGEMGK